MQTFIINSQEVKFEVVEDKIFTNSLHVSKVFAKQHKDVMRTIRDFPDEFNRRNFTPSFYLDKLKREQPLYNLTRDGFSMLVMGFTGKKAFEWKVEFIKAFNKMEELLHVKDPLNTLATVMTAFIKAQSDHNATMLELVKTIATQNKNQLSLYLSPEQLSNIKIEVSKTARAAARVHNISILNAVKETFTSLNAQMGVATYYQIPASAYDEAIEILKEWRELKDDEFEKLTKNTDNEDIIY